MKGFLAAKVVMTNNEQVYLALAANIWLTMRGRELGYSTPVLQVLAVMCSAAVIAGIALVMRFVAAHTSFGGKDYARMDADELVIIARFTSADDAH